MEKLYEEIRGMNLSQNDLLEVFDGFVKSNIKLLDNENVAEILSGNGYFIEQGMSGVKESIVVAMLLFSLDERINFDNILKNCVNYEEENLNISKLNELLLLVTKRDYSKQLKHFFSRLRTNIFISVLEEQKEVRKMVINKKIYSERYQLSLREFHG